MNTLELEGAALDWAVQQCEGTRKDIDFAWWTEDYTPSTNWAQGGPIIEREKITLDYDHEGPTLMWEANHFAFDGTMLQREYGPTPLIAAMRCYVASKLGYTVDVPKEIDAKV
jgi:hypothetical protein